MKSIYWSPSVAVFFACSVSQAVAENSGSTEGPLGTTSTPVEEIMVLASYTPMENSTDLERQDSEIVDAIDADQLEKFGDSDVASAAKRVVGVSINDDKYAVVRGLDGRYISSTLNDNLMPTTDPLRRDIQLDLFPANILHNIKIQKSYSADMPGDSTGGSIGMTTKGLPDELTTKFSISGGYNFDVTGNDIVTYEGSGTDWLTFDDGLRDVPSEIDAVYQGANGANGSNPSTCDVSGCDISFSESSRMSQQLPVIYDISEETAAPNWSLGFSHGNRFDKSFGSLGYYGSIFLGNKTDARIDAEYQKPGKRGTYERSKKSAKMGAYFVLGFEDNKNGEWLSRTTLLRQSEDVTRLEDGYRSYEEQFYTTATLVWNERQFLSQQFSGKHFFLDTHEFEWRVGASQTTMDEPDRRTWTYFSDSFIANPTERRYSDLTEDGSDFGISYLLPVDFSTHVSTAFKAGYLYNERDREWNIARYRFVDHPRASGLPPLDRSLSVENILSRDNLACQDTGNGLCSAYFYLQKSTASTDSFLANIETSAFYLNTETTFGSQWTLVLGARQEDNTQTLEYPYRNSSDPSLNVNVLDESDLLPALSLSFAPNDYWQFRASASQTVSRPGVIERSEASIYDPDTDDQLFGNPSLVSAEIENLDLRAEYYFDDGGNVSLALFGKSITNPIEKTIQGGSGSATDGYGFRNAISADLAGIEIDFNKVLLETSSIAFDIAGNLTFIESEVELDEVSIQFEGEDSIGRELQGQSPILFNMHLGLEHLATQQQANLLVNYFDDKINAVGAGDAIANEFEKGRVTLDFNYIKTFSNESSVKVGLTNILNSTVEYVRDGVTTESYKEGAELSLSYSHVF